MDFRSRTIKRITGRAKNPFEELDQDPVVQEFVRATQALLEHASMGVEHVIVKFDDSTDEKFYVQ